jgi:hypothetical protein
VLSDEIAQLIAFLRECGDEWRSPHERTRSGEMHLKAARALELFAAEPTTESIQDYGWGILSVFHSFHTARLKEVEDALI